MVDDYQTLTSLVITFFFFLTKSFFPRYHHSNPITILFSIDFQKSLLFFNNEVVLSILIFPGKQSLDF